MKKVVTEVAKAASKAASDKKLAHRTVSAAKARAGVAYAFFRSGELLGVPRPGAG